MRTLAAFVESALWTEFITPYVKPDGRVVGASGEELKFINRMRMVGNEDLWQSVVESVGTNLALQQERDEQKRMLKSSSSSVFTLDVEEDVWRRLGVAAGVLTDVSLSIVSFTEDELEQLRSPDSELYVPHNDFLQAPWEIRQGVSVVKGSDPV